jgi:hypothetical protein
LLRFSDLIDGRGGEELPGIVSDEHDTLALAAQ